MEWTGEELSTIFFTKYVDHILISFCNTAKNRGCAVMTQRHTVSSIRYAGNEPLCRKRTTYRIPNQWVLCFILDYRKS